MQAPAGGDRLSAEVCVSGDRPLPTRSWRGRWVKAGTREGWRNNTNQKSVLTIQTLSSPSTSQPLVSLQFVTLCIRSKTPIIKLSVTQTFHFNLEENQHHLNAKQAASRKLLGTASEHQRLCRALISMLLSRVVH